MNTKVQGTLGGATSGAITGATLGSVIPGVGTGLGALGGGLVGGAMGFFGAKGNDDANSAQKAGIDAAMNRLKQYQADSYARRMGDVQKTLAFYGPAGQMLNDRFHMSLPAVATGPNGQGLPPMPGAPSVGRTPAMAQPPTAAPAPPKSPATAGMLRLGGPGRGY